MENVNNRIISLQDLFKGRNQDFDNTPANAIKLIRHADTRVAKPNSNKEKKELLIDGNPVPDGISGIYELYTNYRELFDKYQSEQKKGSFEKIRYVVVFMGESGTTARLLGVYEILSKKQSTVNEEEEILELVPLKEFHILEEKIIIDWGKSTVSWHQYYSNIKDVIRIESGRLQEDGTPIFKNYLDVILNYKQLVQVLKNNEWAKQLQALNCIYLIVDKSNGKKYVGSTYNRQGIYGRWQDYAKTGHGGNKDLEEIVKNDPMYHVHNFQWSILETLSITITQPEAIAREKIWKRKLLTYGAFGYTNN